MSEKHDGLLGHGPSGEPTHVDIQSRHRDIKKGITYGMVSILSGVGAYLEMKYVGGKLAPYSAGLLGMGAAALAAVSACEFVGQKLSLRFTMFSVSTSETGADTIDDQPPVLDLTHAGDAGTRVIDISTLPTDAPAEPEPSAVLRTLSAYPAEPAR